MLTNCGIQCSFANFTTKQKSKNEIEFRNKNIIQNQRQGPIAHNFKLEEFKAQVLMRKSRGQRRRISLLVMKMSSINVREGRVAPARELNRLHERHVRQRAPREGVARILPRRARFCDARLQHAVERVRLDLGRGALQQPVGRVEEVDEPVAVSEEEVEAERFEAVEQAVLRHEHAEDVCACGGVRAVDSAFQLSGVSPFEEFVF